MAMALPAAFIGDSIGSGEIMVVLILALLLFGAERLPELARSLGRALAQFRRASQDFHDQIVRADEPEISSPDTESPPETLPPDSGTCGDAAGKPETPPKERAG